MKTKDIAAAKDWSIVAFKFKAANSSSGTIAGLMHSCSVFAALASVHVDNSANSTQLGTALFSINWH
jgi:hypothetical protein